MGSEIIYITVFDANGIPEVLQFGSRVYFRMLERIAHKYKVQVEWFYNPEIIMPGPATSQ